MRQALDWLSPASLAGRTVLTLMAGLLAFHLGSLWLLERGVHGALQDDHVGHAADRLAAAWRTLDAVPPAMRPAVARALSSAGFEFGWQATAPGDLPRGAVSGPLPARMRELLPGVAEIWVADTGSGSRTAGAFPLPDGSWLTFTASPPHGADALAHASIASLSAMALGIVLASLLVVRWITGPLRRLAAAAEGFGQGAAPAPIPLPESGPREVREAARTFNAMQARIQRLVADRTQALAAVSHDLRSPIQRLRLRAGFIDDTETQRSIDSDLDEMEAMVDGTLAYLRGDAETEEAKPADLAAILRTVCDDATDRGCKIVFIGPDRAPLRLRPVAIKRAFANLIDNALKYGGGIARVTLQDLSSEATVWVEDEGSGIPETAMEAVFEPFRRLEESRNRGTGGSGLGLTIARRVVQGHGGAIALANRPRGGLTVTVRLPRTA